MLTKNQEQGRSNAHLFTAHYVQTRSRVGRCRGSGLWVPPRWAITTSLLLRMSPRDPPSHWLGQWAGLRGHACRGHVAPVAGEPSKAGSSLSDLVFSRPQGSPCDREAASSSAWRWVSTMRVTTRRVMKRLELKSNASCAARTSRGGRFRETKRHRSQFGVAFAVPHRREESHVSSVFWFI